MQPDLQARGDLKLLLSGQPMKASEWPKPEACPHVQCFKKHQLLVISIELCWVVCLQSCVPSSWGVGSPDTHRRVGQGTWLHVPNKTLWWYLTYYQKLEVRNPLNTQVQTKPGEGEGNRTTEINLGYRCGLTLRIVGIDSIDSNYGATVCF